MANVDDLKGPAGALEAALDLPGDGRQDEPLHAAVVFAHPHPQLGGTMQTKVVYQAAKALARIGCAVLRFNFRGVGRSAGQFDEGVGEIADFAAALDYMAARYPSTRLWAAGFSFGSWVALETGAVDDRVSALIGIAPPVATSISGKTYAFSNTIVSSKAKFLIQGEADDICPVEALWRFYGQLPEPKELVVIDAADHLFEGKTQDVGEALEDLLADF
jgi:alpha/beta superfamily hydrolase